MSLPELIRAERTAYVAGDAFLQHYSDINEGCCRMFGRHLRE
jgi:hypothetical protein